MSSDLPPEDATLRASDRLVIDFPSLGNADVTSTIFGGLSISE